MGDLGSRFGPPWRTVKWSGKLTNLRKIWANIDDHERGENRGPKFDNERQIGLGKITILSRTAKMCLMSVLAAISFGLDLLFEKINRK